MGAKTEQFDALSPGCRKRQQKDLRTPHPDFTPLALDSHSPCKAHHLQSDRLGNFLILFCELDPISNVSPTQPSRFNNFKTLRPMEPTHLLRLLYIQGGDEATPPASPELLPQPLSSFPSQHLLQHLLLQCPSSASLGTKPVSCL